MQSWRDEEEVEGRSGVKKGSGAVRWLFALLSETRPTFLSPDTAFMGTQVLMGKSVRFPPSRLFLDFGLLELEKRINRQPG